MEEITYSKVFDKVVPKVVSKEPSDSSMVAVPGEAQVRNLWTDSDIWTDSETWDD